jgi:hypothetical protein
VRRSHLHSKQFVGIPSKYTFPLELVRIIRSGIHPESGDPTAWYDRTIRVIGPIMMLAVFLLGLVFLIAEKLGK